MYSSSRHLTQDLPNVTAQLLIHLIQTEAF